MLRELRKGQEVVRALQAAEEARSQLKLSFFPLLLQSLECQRTYFQAQVLQALLGQSLFSPVSCRRLNQCEVARGMRYLHS